MKGSVEQKWVKAKTFAGVPLAVRAIHTQYGPILFTKVETLSKVQGWGLALKSRAYVPILKLHDQVSSTCENQTRDYFWNREQRRRLLL